MTTMVDAGGKVYEFGLRDRLRVARESTGLTQKEFAAITGISHGSIYNYEKGLTKPRRPQLAAWALATGFDVGWLVSGKVPNQGGHDDDGGQQRPQQDSNLQPSDKTFSLMGLAA